jgi:hypothetical protein
MADTNTLARSLHDTGLAAWFGGSLMGAIGVNGAAAEVDQPSQRARVASAGWGRWTPVNAAAIGTHLIGGALIVGANKGRIAGQSGVATWTTAKTVLTGAALGLTAWSGALGRKIAAAGDVPVEGGTDPAATTPPEVASAQRQLKVLQWAIPAVTGAILVVNAYMGEQQRPKEVLGGTLRRFLPGTS